LRTKQPIPGILDTVRIECEDRVHCSADERSRFYFITFAHSALPGRKAPVEVGREGFYNILVNAYVKLGLPEITHGMVALELHEDGAPHLHADVETSKPHRWKAIEKGLRTTHGVKVHFSKHTNYRSMCEYLTKPSKRKPRASLDNRPYFSTSHPELSEVYARACHNFNALKSAWEGRHNACAEKGSERAEKPPRGYPTVVRYVLDSGLRGPEGAVAFKAAALRLTREGKHDLLRFEKAHRRELTSQLDAIWDLNDAEAKLCRVAKSRFEILEDAAKWACQNVGRDCKALYSRICEMHKVDEVELREAIYDAAVNGRKKGNAVMIVGPKDTGKTTVLEPAGKIFEHFGTCWCPK